MSENLSSSPQIEIKEQPVDQSLQLANEFFNTLSRRDKKMFMMTFETPEAFSKVLASLTSENQELFQKLLKESPSITSEITVENSKKFLSEVSELSSGNLDIASTKLQDILNRYKLEVADEKLEVADEKLEVADEKLEVADEKLEVADEKLEVAEQVAEDRIIRDKMIEQDKMEFFALSKDLFSTLNISEIKGFDTWKIQAESEILDKNPELKQNPEELESYVNAYILMTHSESIIKEQPIEQQYELRGKLNTLKNLSAGIDIFKNIESKKEAELIDESFGKSDILKRDLQQAKASLLPDGQELKIDGKILTSGDQKLTFGDNGPKKEISRHGYSIDTTEQFSPDYKFKYESQNMRQLYQKTVADYKTAEKNLNEVEATIKEIDEKIAKADDDLLKDAYKAEKEQLMQTEVVSFQQQFDKQRQTLLEVYDQANAIDVEEKQRIPEYQNLQQQKDAQARETLDFLNNMGLTYIPQDTFEQLLTRINKNPQMYGFPREITLESGLGGTLADKKAIKEGFYNLFTKLYEKIGVDLKGITVDKFINGTAGDQFKNQTFDTLLENPGGFKTKGTFNSVTFIDFMLAPKEGSEAKQ